MDGTWGRRCGGGVGARSGIHDEVLGASVQASTPSKQQRGWPARGAASPFATPPSPPDTDARKQLKRHPIIPRSSSSAAAAAARPGLRPLRGGGAEPRLVAAGGRRRF